MFLCKPPKTKSSNRCFHKENSNMYAINSDNYSYPHHGQKYCNPDRSKSDKKLVRNTMKRLLLEDMIHLVNHRQ